MAPPRPVEGALRAAGARGQLGLRLASASLLIPIALGLTWLGGLWFAALAGLAAWRMQYEWARLVQGSVSARDVAVGGAVGLAAALPALAAPLAGLVLLGLSALAAGALARLRPGWVALGPLYVGLPCLAIVWLRGGEVQGFALILWLFAVVWATDTAAFFTGRALGGPKLAPRLSPNKTWSGAIGGLVGALAVAGPVAALLGHTVTAALLAVGLAVALLSECGDMVESAVKRRFAVKDAGGLIPGHGGALDRLDSLLLAVPLLAGLRLAGVEVPAWS